MIALIVVALIVAGALVSIGVNTGLAGFLMLGGFLAFLAVVVGFREVLES